MEKTYIIRVAELSPSKVRGIELTVAERLPGSNISAIPEYDHVKFTTSSESEVSQVREIIETIVPVLEVTDLGSEPAEQTYYKGVLYIQGMTCQSCTGSVNNLLTSFAPTVTGVSVSLVTKSAQILFDKSMVDDPEEYLAYLAEEVDDLFHVVASELVEDVSNTMLKCFFQVGGVIPEQALRELPFVKKVRLHPDNFCEIQYDGHAGGVRNIEEVLQNFNCIYEIKTSSSNFDAETIHAEEQANWRRRLLWSLLFAVPASLLSMLPLPSSLDQILATNVIGLLSLKSLLLWILVTPVQFGPGLFFYTNGWSSVRHGLPNMSVLVALGSSAAYLYSLAACFTDIIGSDSLQGNEDFFETCSTLITVIILGKFLESFSKGRTTRSMNALLEGQEKVANVVILDGEGKITSLTPMDVNRLHIGDLLLVDRGGKAAVDGIIKYGNSQVDASAITGEPIPHPKHPGDEILCGSVNLDQPIIMRTTTVANITTMNTVINLMKQAQADKVPIQKIADQISAVFVPVVLCIAGLTFFIWYGLINLTSLIPESWLKGSDPFFFSLLFSIAVLVIACPCALGLASPTALMVGSGVALKNGILIKTGSSLEVAKNIQTMVFDKTGTLTIGKPSLAGIRVFSNFSEEDVLTYAASAEILSEHILAKALISASKDRNLALKTSSDFQAKSGKGISAKVDGKEILVGNRTWLQDNDVQVATHIISKLEADEEDGHTVLYVAIGSAFVAALLFRDQPRLEAADVIQHLKRRMNIDVYMLTGDNKGASHAIADEIGIEKSHVIAGVLPHEKHEHIERLQQRGARKVAMVGDGINDAAALAQADISFSVGAGTEIALEASDMVLMQNDLTQIINAIDLSKTVLNRIKLNFIFSFMFNVCGIPIAAGVLYPLFFIRIPPILAASAMACSSVLVVTSSLMLNCYRPAMRRQPPTESTRRGNQMCANECPCCCSPLNSERTSLLNPGPVCTCVNCNCKCSNGQIVSYMAIEMQGS